MLPPGQKYAVDFLKSRGLSLISTPLQLKKGTLAFIDKNGNRWAIYKQGYIRKWNDYAQNSYSRTYSGKEGGYPNNGQWGVLHSFDSPLSDDQYMDAAEILSEKVSRSYKKVSKGYVESRVKIIQSNLIDMIKGLKGNTRIPITDAEIKEAVKRIYESYD
jgi:hypothetical protein